VLHLLRPTALAGAVALCAATPADAPTPQGQGTPSPPVAAEPLGTEAVPADQVVALLGLSVAAQGASDVGRIVDVLVDANGRPRAAVIDVGGFLGVGNRKVAVAWRALRFSLGTSAGAALSVAADRIKSAPAYDPAKPVQAVEAPPPPPPAKGP